jgi:hypothetical protein
MKREDKETVKAFVPETLLYGALAAGFCVGVARLLGLPMVSLFHRHPAWYGVLALGLMVFQGFVLERAAHAICSLFRPRGKAPG